MPEPETQRPGNPYAPPTVEGAPLAGGALALASIAGILFARHRLTGPLRLRLRRIEKNGMVVLDGVNIAAAEAIAVMYAQDDE